MRGGAHGCDRTVRWLVGAFLLTLFLVNPYLRGDGHEYYAYLRSLVIDGDLQFENEYLRGDPAFRRAMENELVVLPTGYRRNPAAVGPAMLWAPWFLAAHGGVLVARRVGSDLAADGYSWPYRWACAVGTAGYGFAGLLLARAVARRYVSPAAAALGTVGIWAGSSLPVYMYFLPFHVPALAAFTVALFVWSWVRVRERGRARDWIGWGAAGGLVAATYYLDVVLSILPAMELVRVPAAMDTRLSRARAGATRALLFALPALGVLMPTFIIKAIIHGSPFETGYAGELFYWTDPRLWAVGFSSEHGVFTWTPVVLVSVVGLLLLWRTDRAVAGPALLVFAAFYYVVASFVNWHGNSSYGNRFLVALTAFFVLGLAVVIDRLGHSARVTKQPNARRLRLAPVAIGLTLLAAWNGGLMFQWGMNVIPNRGPVDFAVVALNQVTVVPQGVVGFVGRYFTAREQLVREVEERDLAELPGYRQLR